MIDFLIVGQGLAGTVLSDKLNEAGYTFKFIDNGHKYAASSVAAGIINPITGRRFVKSWMIDVLIPEAIRTYQKLEALLDIKLINKLNIIRALTSIKHENDWFARYEDLEYQDYLLQSSDLGAYQNILKGEIAYGEILQCYQIDIANLIKAYRDYLESKELIVYESFDYAQLKLEPNYIEYKDLEARQIIFSEGYKAIDNPYFAYLPFEPVKGEVVIFEGQDIPKDRMLRHDQYIVPTSSGVFWSGGGYDKVNLNQEPTETFFDKWKTDIDGFLKTSYRVTNRLAGVRPAVKGRRPIIGRHSDHPNVLIFNGMGTKGTSLAPFCAEQLIALIKDKRKVNAEIDIDRFR